MLRYVCENAIVLMLIALMTATIVPIGLVLLNQAIRFAY